MYAYDVDGDGDNDVVSSLDAHNWGLAWFEQIQKDGEIDFIKHLIVGNRSQEDELGVAFSQPHAIEIADLDGDGLIDIICGKDKYAHGGNRITDPELNGPAVLYWFKLNRTPSGAKFTPLLLDKNTGVGRQISVKDMNGDGRPDILTATHNGAFVFINKLAH